MATITAIAENKFRVQIRKKGQTSAKTFTAKDLSEKAIQKAHDDAVAWGVLHEGNIDAGNRIGMTGKVGMTFGEAVDRFIAENKGYCATAYFVLKALKVGLGHVDISKITDDDIVQFIKNKDVAPGSAAVDFSYIRSVLKMAHVGWGYHVPDIVGRARDRLKILKLIGKSRERDRRITEHELKLLLAHNYNSKIPMADIIQFAISSAMRQAEITRIKFETLKMPTNAGENPTILVTDRKHPTMKSGNDKIVPLLPASLVIIERQRHDTNQEFVFPFNEKTVGTLFSDSCKLLGIKDLHFHDLRHEGTTRLFEMGYQVHEVQLFTGHMDLKTLQRYMHLKPQNVRRLEPAKAEAAPAGMDAETMKQFKQFLAMKKMMEAEEA